MVIIHTLSVVIQGYTLVHLVIHGCILGYGWFCIAIHRNMWFTSLYVVLHVYIWVVGGLLVVIHALLVVVHGYTWLHLVIHGHILGYGWLCIGIHGYMWFTLLYVVIHVYSWRNMDCRWVYVVMGGYKCVIGDYTRLYGVTLGYTWLYTCLWVIMHRYTRLYIVCIVMWLYMFIWLYLMKHGLWVYMVMSEYTCVIDG